LKVAAA
jgi:hypothetical protein